MVEFLRGRALWKVIKSLGVLPLERNSVVLMGPHVFILGRSEGIRKFFGQKRCYI